MRPGTCKPERAKRASRRASAAKDYTRPGFSEAFNICCKISSLEKQLCGEGPLTKRQRTIIKEEIQNLEDSITRGKTRFAAEQHQELIKATLEILRSDSPLTSERSFKTVADIIRQLDQKGSNWYENAHGTKIRYTDGQVRKILNNVLNLTEALRTIK